MKDAIANVRPLNDAWKKRYEKWNISAHGIAGSIEQSCYGGISNGATPLITFKPSVPTSENNNSNQNVTSDVSSTDLRNSETNSEWKRTL